MQINEEFMAAKISGAMERALRDWRLKLFGGHVYRIAAKHNVSPSAMYRAIKRINQQPA